MEPLTFPARPRNGGPLDLALRAGAYAAIPGQPAWFFEPKYNGWRALVHVPTGSIFNRHGAPLSIQADFGDALAQLARTPFEWLDTEALDRRHHIAQGTLVILDWPMSDMPDLRRRDFLAAYFNEPGSSDPTLFSRKVDLAPRYDLAGSSALWDELKEVNADLGCTFYEGVVAKRWDFHYPVQLNSDAQEFPHWVKHRFTTK